MRAESAKAQGKPSRSLRRGPPVLAGLPDDYFRVRDFEYVQPLYDLAFLLEVNALANKSEVPKYRTFSLWKAAYSLDGYGTTIDRWLDGIAKDDDLDYVPSPRIRQHLSQIRKTGSHPELRPYQSARFSRCLRLRSVRGLGPAQIAQTIRAQSLSDEWLRKAEVGTGPQYDRMLGLFKGEIDGPWQSAHIVPPLLRFLHHAERVLGQPVSWHIEGLEDPFKAVLVAVTVEARLEAMVLKSAITGVLKRERLFRCHPKQPAQGLRIRHQLGWSFTIEAHQSPKRGCAILELARELDPFVHPGGNDNDLLSDLHLHTAWSDGSASVNAMAQAIVANGLKFFAVTDHSRSSKLQGGLTPVLWLRQANALSLAAPICPVLHGIEVDILKDGSLDLPHSLLAAADLVVASVHSSWTTSIHENTQRLLRAIETGCVDILAHPTSAVIGKPGVPDYLREPANVDWDTVFAWCARWHVALEMNCFPSRLDLSPQLLRKAIAAGCAISIGSDAHARSHLQNLRFGEAALRQLDAPVVLNRLPLDGLRSWIRAARLRRNGLTKSTAFFDQAEFRFDAETKQSTPPISARIQPPRSIPTGSRVVGIDLTAGDKPTGVALLNELRVETCSLSTDEDILSFVRRHRPMIVSIDSPLGLPGGGQTIDRNAGIVRVAEHDLASIGIPSYPALIDSMEKLTLRGIGLRRAIEAFPKPPLVIESYPGAAQDILCIPRKQKSLALLREGLRRLGLEGAGLDTKSHDEMDAITSAIVGRYHEARLFEPMGIPSEAQLIVPKVGPLAFEHDPVICLAGKTGAGKSVAARYLSVFYGFTWVRTRDVIRDLLLEDAMTEPTKRLWDRTVEPSTLTEADLRDFGAVILNKYKQEPLRKQVLKTVRNCHAPVVVDSIRDPMDVERGALGDRPMLIWFVDCPDAIIRNRLIETRKLGEKRISNPTPVDRTAPEIRLQANQIISNSGSLEDLRWSVDNSLFAAIRVETHRAS